VTAVKTRAEIQIGPGAEIKVEPFLRLTGNTGMWCLSYDDHAPILLICDGNVRLSVSVPDVRQVTGEDIAWGRALAEIVAQYVTGLEHRITVQDAAGDQAA
jgi:hypothetical protein